MMHIRMRTHAHMLAHMKYLHVQAGEGDAVHAAEMGIQGMLSSMPTPADSSASVERPSAFSAWQAPAARVQSSPRVDQSSPAPHALPPQGNPAESSMTHGIGSAPQQGLLALVAQQVRLDGAFVITKLLLVFHGHCWLSSGCCECPVQTGMNHKW